MPAANTTLFQSALVIIIQVSVWRQLLSCHFTSLTRRMLLGQIRSKSLASKNFLRPLCCFPLKLPLERYSLTLQRIVEQEQTINFISRLHGGKVDIMPWPVVESGQFYQLFETIKRRLDEQKISHPTAGGFFHTIKVLIAKLKVRALIFCQG